MKRTLQIGYLNSITVAPLIVGEHKGWFSRIGLSLDLTLEIGWGSLIKGMVTGGLDGAIVPPCFPFTAYFETPDREKRLTACSCLGFGGTRVVCNKAVRDSLRSNKQPERLRYGVAGSPGGNLYYIKRWLNALNKSEWIKCLEPVQVTDTQNANFLNSNAIDLYVCIEPWGLTHTENSQAQVIRSGDIFEDCQLSRMLVLQNDVLNRSVTNLPAFFAVLQDSSRWANDPANFNELAEIFVEHGYYDRSSKVVKFLVSDDHSFRKNGFSFLRPKTGDITIQASDFELGWELYSCQKESGTGGIPAIKRPEGTEKMFFVYRSEEMSVSALEA